jgi:hypothetical protein
MILVNGDSWTGGPTYPSVDDHWPYQMAKKHNLSLTNLAWAGASNQRIFRTTVEFLHECKETPTHLIIGWSDISRYEFPTSIGEYIRITSIGCDIKGVIPHYNMLKDAYYNHMYNEELMYKQLTHNIFILQNICKSKNIKFLNFNSFKSYETLQTDSKTDNENWIIDPKETMDRILKFTLNFGVIQSKHTTVEGQRYWADFVYSKL